MTEKESETEAAPGRIERLCSSPYYGAVTVVMGAIAGTFASVHSSRLINNIPFSSSLPDPAITIITGLLIFAFGLLFFGGQWAQNKIAQRTQSGLKLVVAKLQTTVDELQSLPPVTFLDAMTEAHRGSAQLLAEVIPSEGKLTLGEIDAFIRTLLGYIVGLSDRFHVHDSAARTAANIMVFRDKYWLENLTPSEIKLIKVKLKFCDGMRNDIQSHDGMLDLIRSLSTSNATKSGDRDSELIDMSFPIDGIADDKALNKEELVDLIPGAPTAFAARVVFSYGSQAQLLMNAGKSNMRDSDREAMRNYLLSDPGRLVQSFVSIPLFPANAREDVMPLAVLNLHRNTDDLLVGEGTKRFIPICQPLLFGISWLLKVRLEAELSDLPSKNSVESMH